MRQFLAQTPLAADGTLAVCGKDYRYLRQVLRLKSGDMLLVRLVDGQLQPMTVCRVDEAARRIVLQVCAAGVCSDRGAGAATTRQLEDDGVLQEAAAACVGGVVVTRNHGAPAMREATLCGGTTPVAAGSLPELWLFQFVARNAKMDVIIRQATECGVSVIVPVVGDYSQMGGGDRNFRNERYGRIIREARQQSGSAIETRVHDTVTLAEAIALWQKHCNAVGAVIDNLESVASMAVQDNAVSASASAASADGVTSGRNTALACVLSERTERTRALHEAVRVTTSGAVLRAVALVCGAEGGISPQELERLAAAGFVPVHFKTNILRCETAALYGIAALQSAVSERDVWQ